MPGPTLDAANANQLDAFDRQVETALEAYADAAWLGEHSPLAAPYFIGAELPPIAGTATRAADGTLRGERLRALLAQCAGDLDPELQQLLELTYFARNRRHDNAALAQHMNMSERTYYRAKQRAIKGLAAILNQTLAPPLRAERPISRTVVGRQDATDRLLACVQAGGSACISGASGMGKTTLGAAVARQWQAVTGRPFFWYTLRRHVNDQPESFLFTLAHFLRGLGAAALWRQLVADRGALDLARTLCLLRHELQDPALGAILICVDELDILHEAPAAHAQIIHLLEELRTLAPLLLLGQRALIESDVQVVLEGLDPAAAGDLLATHGIAFDALDAARLTRITQNAPALLVLVAALVRAGEEPATALALLDRTEATEAIVRRIWQRLDDEERAMLSQLAVFRAPAPQDAWPDAQPPLHSLHERRLITLDEDGRVEVIPYLRPLIYARLEAADRAALHLRAATIRAERAEIVAAMEHARHSDKPAYAVWLWFTRRHEEVERGQGAAALAVLQEIEPESLPDERDRTAYAVACTELYHLTGQGAAAEGELRRVPVVDRSATGAYVHFVTGQVKLLQDQVEQALESFRAALESYTALPQVQPVLIHTQTSFLHMYRRHDVERARREAILARAKADAFLGDLEIMAGHYRAALARLQAASDALEPYAGELATRSRIYSYLGALHGRLGATEQALAFIEQATACDRQRGDAVGPLYDTLNRAAVLHGAGRNEESRQVALQGLAAAEGAHNSYLIAGLSAGVAEACAGLARWEEAEFYALASLEQEEEFFRAPALGVLALARSMAQRHADAQRMIDAALENARQIEDRYMEACTLRCQAAILRRAGDTAQADRAQEAAIAIFRALELDHEAARAAEPLLSGA